jgi:hypothetical protein
MAEKEVKKKQQPENKNRCVCPYTDCAHNKSRCALPTQNRFVKVENDQGKAMLLCPDYANQRCKRCGIVVGETYLETSLNEDRLCSKCQDDTRGKIIIRR